MKTVKYLPLLLVVSLFATAASARGEPAVFTVTQEVINPGLDGVTATVNNIGNRASERLGSGFEPLQWRDKLIITEGHASAVIASESDISAHDRLREGFLDGAEVMVFRVIDGKMTLVRRDRIRDGGHKASGWRSITRSSELVAPQANSFEGGFEDWNRPDTDYWFAVTAVAADGAESPFSNAVKFTRRAEPGKANAKNTMVAVKLPRDKKQGELPPPANLRVRENPANGDAVLQWSAGEYSDLAGFRVWRSDYAPEQHQGFRLELESTGNGREVLQKGDMVLLHKAFYQPSRKKLLTQRVYDSSHRRDIKISGGPSFFPDEDPSVTWRLEPHSKSSPVDGAGETALRIDMEGERRHRLDQYAFGDTQQFSRWWPVLNPEKEYVVEIWMRQQGMENPLVEFSVEGAYRREMKPLKFAVGKKWQKHQATFKVPRLLDTKGPVGKMAWTFSGPGTLWLDNYRVYEKGTPYLALLPEDEQVLKQSKVAALRSHQFVKTFRNTYNMQQLTNSAGAVNATKGNTLPQFLEIVDRAGIRPWLQVEFFMSPEEWLGFVEYMAAPYDPEVDSPEAKPWAAKRYAQGRSEPWTEAFDRIYFELSNETWNGLFSPWTFQSMPDAATGKTLDRGTVYGLFQEWVIDQLQASPYWKPGLEQKIQFVIGGWAHQTEQRGYGARAIAASPRSQLMTIADYIGGWDEGEGPASTNHDSFQRVLMHAAQLGRDRSRGHADTAANLAKDGVDYQLGIYEGGPGYAMSGLNNQGKMTEQQKEEQAQTMKSLAAGTATLDSWLDKAAHGFTLNNFFTWSRGHNYWNSHAIWYDGGQAYPSWLGLEMFNHHGTGDLLRVKAQSVDTIDMPAHGKRKAQKDLPLTAAYASRRDDRLSVFVISRKLGANGQGDTPVELQLPISNAQKLTLYRMTGAPTAHNLYEQNVAVETLAIEPKYIGPTLPINALTGGTAAGLPPASVYLYVFEGAEFVEAPVQESEANLSDSLKEIWHSVIRTFAPGRG